MAPQPPPLHPFLTLADGTRIRYQAAGPEDGPPVLLLNGITVPLETWDRNSGTLAARGLRVYRFDYPGRGWSDRPRGAAFDLEFFAAAALSFLGALGHLGLAKEGPFGLVGLSMGGAVAALLAARHPALFTRVAFVDPLFFTLRLTPAQKLLFGPGTGDLLFALAGKALLSRAQRGDFHDPEAADRFLPLYRGPFAKPGLTRAVLSTWRSAPRWSVTPHFEALGRRNIPLRVLWGTEDRTIPFGSHRELLALLPGADFVAIPGAGHVPQWERPDDVNTELTGFFLRS